MNGKKIETDHNLTKILFDADKIKQNTRNISVYLLIPSDYQNLGSRHVSNLPLG